MRPECKTDLDERGARLREAIRVAAIDLARAKRLCTEINAAQNAFDDAVASLKAYEKKLKEDALDRAEAANIMRDAGVL